MRKAKTIVTVFWGDLEFGCQISDKASGRDAPKGVGSQDVFKPCPWHIRVRGNPELDTIQEA